MRPGTSGQSGKTVPIYFTDPKADASTPSPRSKMWRQPNVDQPHWDEVLDASQEDVEFCEDGETTIARDGATATPSVFYMMVDDKETTVEENELPQILLQAPPAYRQPGYGAVREELNAARKARGFFGARRACQWNRRYDTAHGGRPCASRIGRMQRRCLFHRRGAGCATTSAGGSAASRRCRLVSEQRSRNRIKLHASPRSSAPETPMHERQYTSRGTSRSIHTQAQTSAGDIIGRQQNSKSTSDK